eukprot:augustus_masked-scaffold_5-processed-gene-7.43-mRNA-1 protein AED:1.00 eAED:1.00 QI:0/-1/0/0/-1/1/1/0/581
MSSEREKASSFELRKNYSIRSSNSTVKFARGFEAVGIRKTTSRGNFKKKTYETVKGKPWGTKFERRGKGSKKGLALRFLGGSQQQKEKDSEASCICTRCSKFIYFNERLEYNEVFYHENCFRCAECNDLLIKGQSMPVRKGQLICKNCSQRPKLRKHRGLSFQASNFNITRTFSKFGLPEIIESGGTVSSLEEIEDELLTDIRSLQMEYPFNTALCVVDGKLIQKLKNESELKNLSGEKAEEKVNRLRNTLQRAFTCPSHPVGAFVNGIKDLDMLRPFFLRLVKTLCSVDQNLQLPSQPEKYAKAHGHVADLKKDFDLVDQSIGYTADMKFQIRCLKMTFTRNFAGYDLIGSLNVRERLRLERKILAVISAFRAEYPGDVHSCSRDARAVSERYIKLSKSFEEHLLDVNRTQDAKKTQLAAAFPSGAGIYVSQDKSIRILYNHVDHFKISVVNKSTTSLKEMYQKLSQCMSTFENIYERVLQKEISYHFDNEFGIITSDPTQFGIGFSASAKVDLPNLIEDSTLNLFSKKFNLTARRVNRRSHQVDVYPNKKVFDLEESILKNFHDNLIKLLLEEEKADFV